ncbi:MAG: hypothetical protein IKA61_00015 [Clostridia bacterium]|nr:hypothetical protein [Clostridia bacterium]
MRKILKTLVASMMVAVVMVVAGACSSREKIVERYDSIDEFVAEFGTTLEKVNPEDECCLFDEGVIQSSVEEVLQCRIEAVWYRASLELYKDAFNRPYKYEYEGFDAIYKLLDRQDVSIATLAYSTNVVASINKDKYELLEQIVVDDCEIGIYQPIKEIDGRTVYEAMFNEGKMFNRIELTIYDEYTREVFTCTEFVLLIEPIIKGRTILK